MKLVSGQTVWSPRDISQWDRCPWSVARDYASLRRGLWPAPPIDQPMRELMTGALVDHRARVERMWQRSSLPVVHDADLTPDTAAQPLPSSGALFLHPRVTAEDLSSGLLVETTVDALIPAGDDSYRIEQARLGRWNMRRKLIDTAGAREAFRGSGMKMSPSAGFVLADCSRIDLELDEAIDQWREAAQSVAELVALIDNDRVDLEWETSPLDQCGRDSCAWCQQALADSDDLFHIARLRRSTRGVLRQAGYTTMRGFAEASVDEITRSVTGVDSERLRRDHIQASLQVLAEHSTDGRPPAAILDTERLAQLAPPGTGDLYLDFEGDPAYREWEPEAVCEPGASGPATWLGIDYLIGVVESDTTTYRSWWADNFAEEASAWHGFVEWLSERITRNPELRVYHYASYEVTALRRLAERHGIGRGLVDALVDSGQLIDLYRTTMASMVIGTPGYSLKDLEVLYFDGTERSAIRGGGESVLAFERYRQALGEDAQTTRNAIVAYNEVDCRSTRALHAWLLGQRETPGH